MAVEIVIVDRGIVACRGQGVLREVVRADAEKVNVLQERGNCQGRGRGLDHGAKLGRLRHLAARRSAISNVSRIRRISSSSVTIGIRTRKRWF